MTRGDGREALAFIRGGVATPLLILLLFLSVALPATVAAKTVAEGLGLLFGDDHAFFVEAPKGWVLDSEAGSQQGLPMLFYPAGPPPADGPLIFGASVSKKSIPSVKAQVERTVREFRANGFPSFHVVREERVDVGGRRVPLVIFTSEGGWEASAYFEEEETINALVLSTPDRETFERAMPALREALDSYRNGFPGRKERLDPASFGVWKAKAGEFSRSEEGKAYEHSLADSLGEEVWRSVKGCLTLVEPTEVSDFHLFLVIDPDGTTSSIPLWPAHPLAVCTRAVLLGHELPPHPGGFVLHLSIEISLPGTPPDATLSGGDGLTPISRRLD